MNVQTTSHLTLETLNLLSTVLNGMSSYKEVKDNFKQKMLAELEEPKPDQSIYNVQLEQIQRLAEGARALEDENIELRKLLNDAVGVIDMYRSRTIIIPWARLQTKFLWTDRNDYLRIEIDEKDKWVLKNGCEIEKEKGAPV